MPSHTRRLHVTTGGETRVVDVDGAHQARVEGLDAAVEVRHIDDATSQAVVAGRAILVHVAEVGDETWVFADGATLLVDIDRPGRRGRHQTDTPELSAPMPATVVAVHVSPGQEVRRGEILVVLEAMKMELTLSAPRDGRVDTVTCSPGQLVQPEAPLVTLQQPETESP